MLKMTWRSKLTLVLCKRNAYKTAVHRETSVLADKTWRKHYLLCCIRKINHKAEFSGAFPDASFETKTSAQGGFPTYIFASHPVSLVFLICAVIFPSKPLLISLDFSFPSLCVHVRTDNMNRTGIQHLQILSLNT